MRFACQSCGKAYNLPEDKIADKSNVKLKCRVCGAIVEVKRQGEVVAQLLADVDAKRVRVSEAPAPQVVSMAAPSMAAPAGRAPEPEPPEADEPVPLKLVRKVDPEYPRALLAQQRQGSVLVQFTVRPDGSVDAAQAMRSPDRKLSAAAINAVKQWRFEPIPTPRQVSVEIGFQVD